MSAIIEVKNLSKQFGDVNAVDHLSFSVPAGGIYGFLGPNGSGKTTSTAKLAALEKTRSLTSCKRRRSGSRDGIFRSKREPAPDANPFSRFLSCNPAVMNSLCFATPVQGDSFDFDAASVVSDSNTLNTAEDTITSTLYYETTKLAGLKQNSPPMPLFNSHAVEAQDEIHRIVASRSHNSVNMLTTYKQHPDDLAELGDEEEVTPPTSPRHLSVVNDIEEIPPPIIKLSSDSSKSA